MAADRVGKKLQTNKQTAKGLILPFLFSSAELSRAGPRETMGVGFSGKTTHFRVARRIRPQVGSAAGREYGGYLAQSS